MRQKVGYVMSLCVWALAVAVYVVRGIPWLILAMICIRLLEFGVAAYSAGKYCGKPPVQNFLMTFAFGPFYWAPLRQQQNGTAPVNFASKYGKTGYQK